MIDWRSCPEIERIPDEVSGAWVFSGTRIPVQALFENLVLKRFRRISDLKTRRPLIYGTLTGRHGARVA